MIHPTDIRHRLRRRARNNASSGARRCSTALVAAAALVGFLGACGNDSPPEAPIEGVVTFKTIERPHWENCDPEEYGCPMYSNRWEVSTSYEVEITYPEDKSLFPDPTYADYAGRECWFSVKPDEYAAVELGDTVLLGNPANWDRVFDQGETGCELAQDLSPNGPVPDEEWVPPAEDYGKDPDAPAPEPTGEPSTVLTP